MPKVNDIFNSISGEVSPYHQGRLATFVRFSGCCAECKWCDTNHESFTRYSRTELIHKVKETMVETNHLCITGGEPLLQPDAVHDLISMCPNTWIETSGYVDFAPFIGKTYLVVDFKLDRHLKRGYKSRTTIDDYLNLTEHDFIKFVIGSREQFNAFAGAYFFLKQSRAKAIIAIAPVHNLVTPGQLVDWAYHGNITEVVLNVQLHKIIGLP